MGPSRQLTHSKAGWQRTMWPGRTLVRFSRGSSPTSSTDCAGDRFFYQNESWNADELRIFNQGDTLAKVIAANTGITNLQADVFKFRASISGSVISEATSATREPSSGKGVSGVTVKVEDSDGHLLATTQTDRLGNYSFAQLSGVSGTGDYIVTIGVPSGVTKVLRGGWSILISRGDTHVNNVDFVVSAAQGR